MDLELKKLVNQFVDDTMGNYNPFVNENNEEHILPPTAFRRGYCAEFALALNSIYGFPIVSFDEIIDHGDGDIEESPIHYACRYKSKFVDVSGVRSEANIRMNLLGSDLKPAKNVKVRDVDPDYIDAESMIDDAALKQAKTLIKKLKLINESTIPIYNSALCPDLWDTSKQLIPEVAETLLQVAKDFYEKTKFEAPILDIYLMGSIANYNWTPESDVDVHVIINFPDLKMPIETAEKTVKNASAQWNSEHDITIKGHKVELNIQSVKSEKPYVTGIYSLIKNKWIRNPHYHPVQVDKIKIKSKFSELTKYIKDCINNNSLEQMKAAKDFLDKYRQYGLDHGGELSTENIVYKLLRSKGIIKNLKDSIITTYDKSLTINEGCKREDLYLGYVYPEDNYKIVGIRSDAYSNYSNGGHSELMRHTGIRHNDDGAWRYRKDLNTVFWWGKVPDEKVVHELNDWIFKKTGMKNPKQEVIKVDNYTDNKINFNLAHGIDEVTQKDINAKYPNNVSFFNKDSGWDVSKMTLDNLKALRDKSVRTLHSMRVRPDNDKTAVDYQYEIQYFHNLDSEIKKRLEYINAPVAIDASEMDEIIEKSLNESPLINKRGNKLYADDSNTKLIKQLKVEDVIGNIVICRNSADGFFARGYTLVYFMDSEESANDIKNGKIPYLMIPRGNFAHGGSPITDVWKKKYQRPGQEHILGLIEGNTSTEIIFIDMISVRAGYRRNHIAKLMIDALKKEFPNAELRTSGQTEQGEKFFKSNSVKEQSSEYAEINKKYHKMYEGVGAGIPEDDRLHIPDHRWQIRSKDAPKTPKLNDEE